VTIGVLIVDDEAPARRRLRTLVTARDGFEVIGEARDGVEAVDAIQSLAPGLVLLDVQMPGLGGFEVIEAVGVQAMPPVVFVTAFDEFAVRAFAIEAIDYLVKPIDEARLEQALLRVARRSAEGPGRAALGRLLENVLPDHTFLARIVVRDADRLHIVPVDQVERFTASGNYVEVHGASGTRTMRETLASLEARLDPSRFVRVHRAEIVRLDAVRAIEAASHGDLVLVLESGAAVRASRRFAARLHDALRAHGP
jgi:two-component system LytT family response regulator